MLRSEVRFEGQIMSDCFLMKGAGGQDIPLSSKMECA